MRAYETVQDGDVRVVYQKHSRCWQIETRGGETGKKGSWRAEHFCATPLGLLERIKPAPLICVITGKQILGEYFVSPSLHKWAVEVAQSRVRGRVGYGTLRRVIAEQKALGGSRRRWGTRYSAKPALG